MYKRFVCCCFFSLRDCCRLSQKNPDNNWEIHIICRKTVAPLSIFNFSSLLSIGLHSKKTCSVYRTSLYHKFIIRKSNSNILLPCHKQLYDKIIAIRLISHCRLTVTSATESWIQKAALCFAAVVPVDACRTYFDLKWNGFFLCVFFAVVYFFNFMFMCIWTFDVTVQCIIKY